MREPTPERMRERLSAAADVPERAVLRARAAILLALLWGISPGLRASDTSFDSLAFLPDPSPGPAVELPDLPALNWTRVLFRPQQTNDFPETLRPVHTLAPPASQITGLAVAGADLWMVSRETRSIYRLEAKTGLVRSSFVSPGERPAGLAWDGQVLWQTDGQGRCLYALDEGGTILKRFALPFEPAAVLRTAGELWVSDWEKDDLHRLDPETGRDLGIERAPDDRLTGLTAAGRYWWCSRGDEILCFDPERRLPVCGFRAALTGPNAGTVAGLAADGATLWYATSASNLVVQIRIPGHGQWVAGGGRSRQAGFEMVYRNTSQQAVESLSVLQHVPFLEMPGQRFVSLQIEPSPRALCQAIYYREPAEEAVPGVLRQGYGVCRNYSAALESFGRLLGLPVLNAWAPRHETCFLMLPGVSPAVLEVTANDSGPDPATPWRRSRWFLGTSADEITTGVRGYAMHSRLLVDGVPYTYRWHYWTPAALSAIRHEGWWTVTNPDTGKARRL